MSEKPILFSGDMIRALLDGRKTQTRRMVTPMRGQQSKWLTVDLLNRSPRAEIAYTNPDRRFGAQMEHPRGGPLTWIECPYGRPGDQLWVRENGCERPERTPRMMREGADTWKPYYYDADGYVGPDAADLKAWGFKRRPSIHMPAGLRASRSRLPACVSSGCKTSARTMRALKGSSIATTTSLAIAVERGGPMAPTTDGFLKVLTALRFSRFTRSGTASTPLAAMGGMPIRGCEIVEFRRLP
jgi:hypothetical protein